MSPDIRAVGITAVDFCVPERVLTNRDLEQMVETSDEWIRTRTGISERRIAAPDVAASDLGVGAARKVLARAQLDPAQLDLIIVASLSPDMMFPATACLVQDQIGATRAGAFDLEAGCTGFVYALAMGSQAIAAGGCENVLVIGAEAMSRVVNWQDRRTCVVFGDGAGAALVQPAPPGRGIIAYALRATGAGAEHLKMPAGGSRLPASEETVRQGLHYLQMNGNEIFRFAVGQVEEIAAECLAKAGMTLADVDLIVPHQANSRIIDACAKRMDVPSEKWVCNISRYGNTSTASIPIALTECVDAGVLTPGKVVLLIGFGAGLTFGAVVLRW